MGLNFHVGLPGPFSYSKRIGGKRKPKPDQDPRVTLIAFVLAVITTVAVLFSVYGWWLLLGLGVVGLVVLLALMGTHQENRG